jgi:hypothetical protein
MDVEKLYKALPMRRLRPLFQNRVAIAIILSLFLFLTFFHFSTSQSLRHSSSTISPFEASAKIEVLENLNHVEAAEQTPTPSSIPTPTPTHSPPVPCIGARGKYLDESEDDHVAFQSLDQDYPLPFIGSHDDLNVRRLWSTAEGRYGPYGYPSSNRTQPDWDQVDWGQLQNKCFERNRHRFPEGATDVRHRYLVHRFDYMERAQVPRWRAPDEGNSTGRTAIVIRGYDGRAYRAQEKLYIRSLITEAALESGGKYEVFLLVQIKDQNKKNIFMSRIAYEDALKESGVPNEFWSMTILWHDDLLQSWYPDVRDHR